MKLHYKKETKEVEVVTIHCFHLQISSVRLLDPD
jgi:hypothetical protein